MNLEDISKIKEIFSKMSATLSQEDKQDLLAIVQQVLNGENSVNDDEQEDPIVDIEPGEVRQLTGYRYEASDHKDYLGQYYFMSPAFMLGKIKSVTVGAEEYTYRLDYNGCELWYGKPSQGIITVTFKNGATYKAAESEDPTELKVFGNKEVLKWFGRYNGDRGTWYSSVNKDMADYPDKFWLTVKGCLSRAEVINDGKRYEIGGKAGFIIKQSDVSGRPLAVICPQSCRSTRAWIEY